MRLIYIYFFFINLNAVVYSPLFPHILDAWSKRHHPNMHFMFYEDMKKVNRVTTRNTEISVLLNDILFVFLPYDRICVEKSRKWPLSSGNH